MNRLSIILLISVVSTLMLCGGGHSPGTNNQGRGIDGDGFIDPDSHAGRERRARQKALADRDRWSKERKLFHLKEENLREMRERDKFLRH